MSRSLKPILYLSYDGLSDPLGQSQVLPYLMGLQNEQRPITIISAEKSDRFKKQGQNIKKLLNPTNIHWKPFFYHSKPAVFSTVYDLFTMWKMAKSLLKKNTYIIHCRSYPSAIIGLRLKRKYDCPLIFDMRGFWADERLDGGIWNISNPLHKLMYKYFKKKERQFFEESDSVVSLTHRGVIEIMQKYKVAKNTIQVIPCCTDLTLFNPRNINERIKTKVRQELGLNENQLIITYLGSLGTWYLLDEMLALFHHIQKSKPDAILLFLTNDDETKIKLAAIKAGVITENIRVQSVNRSLVPDYLSISDYSLFFIKPCFSKLASSPTKMGESLSMGIPVIGNSGVGDVADIISNYECGTYVSQFSEQSYQEVVEFINKENYNINESSMKAAKEVYDLENAIGSYQTIYENLD